MERKSLEYFLPGEGDVCKTCENPREPCLPGLFEDVQSDSEEDPVDYHPTIVGGTDENKDWKETVGWWDLI